MIHLSLLPLCYGSQACDWVLLKISISSLPSLSVYHSSHRVHKKVSDPLDLSYRCVGHWRKCWEPNPGALDHQNPLCFWAVSPNPPEVFKMWVLGIEFKPSCCQGKHFIDWAISPVVIIINNLTGIDEQTKTFTVPFPNKYNFRCLQNAWNLKVL